MVLGRLQLFQVDLEEDSAEEGANPPCRLRQFRYVPKTGLQWLLMINTVVPQQMHEDGYLNILNIDYSNVVIEQMIKKYAVSHPELKCKTA